MAVAAVASVAPRSWRRTGQVRASSSGALAVGESVIMMQLNLPLPLLGVSVEMERGCQQKLAVLPTASGPYAWGPSAAAQTGHGVKALEPKLEGQHFAVYLFVHTKQSQKAGPLCSRSTENGPAIP